MEDTLIIEDKIEDKIYDENVIMDEEIIKKRKTPLGLTKKEQDKWLYRNDPHYKEIMTKQALTKLVCSCGCIVYASNMSKHKRTKKHSKLLNIIESQIIKDYIITFSYI